MASNIHVVTPFEKMPWGYTGIFELENGGGLFGTPLRMTPAHHTLMSTSPRIQEPRCEGGLGLSRRLRLVAAHPRSALRGRVAPRPDRHRALH